VPEDKGQVSGGTMWDGKPREIGRRLRAGRAGGLCIESPGGITETQTRQTVCDVSQPLPLVRRAPSLVRSLTLQVVEEAEMLGTAQDSFHLSRMSLSHGQRPLRWHASVYQRHIKAGVMV